jgi:hypothetical protein
MMPVAASGSEGALLRDIRHGICTLLCNIPAPIRHLAKRPLPQIFIAPGCPFASSGIKVRLCAVWAQ